MGKSSDTRSTDVESIHPFHSHDDSVDVQFPYDRGTLVRANPCEDDDSLDDLEQARSEYEDGITLATVLSANSTGGFECLSRNQTCNRSKGSRYSEADARDDCTVDRKDTSYRKTQIEDRALIDDQDKHSNEDCHQMHSHNRDLSGGRGGGCDVRKGNLLNNEWQRIEETKELRSEKSVRVPETSLRKKNRSCNVGDAPKKKKLRVHAEVDRRDVEKNPCLPSGRSKRYVLSILLYAVAVTCLVGWLVREIYKIPGLNSQIDDLSKQVNRLSQEVDRLAKENDRLEDEVDRMQEINDDLEITASKLTDENEKTHALATQFNTSLTEYQEQNKLLTLENEQYMTTTDTLNRTVDNLVSQLTQVTASERQLTAAVAEYGIIHVSLEEDIKNLMNENSDLNNTVNDLDVAIAMFEEENNKFRELNQDLGTIVSFLKDEADDVERSYDELASLLADAITRKEVLAKIGVKDRMKAEIAGWECGLEVAFGHKEFARDKTSAIGYASYDTVLNYISDRLLSDLCIVRGNLEMFLKSEILPDRLMLWDISMKDLTAGVNIYSTKVLEFYFPDEGDVDGIDDSLWNEADYECSNLSYDHRYSYSSSGT